MAATSTKNKLVLGQPALHERSLEHVERLLAVGMRRPERAATSRGAAMSSSRLAVTGASPVSGSVMRSPVVPDSILSSDVCHPLAQGLGERVVWWQGTFAAGEGGADQRDRVG